MTYVKTTIGTSGGGDNTNIGLVNIAGQAWTDAHQNSVGFRTGFILHSNGTVTHIDDYYGYWDSTSSGIWFASGNQLSITGGYFIAETHSYTLSSNGNILAWGSNVILSRTDIGILGGGGELDERLILPNGWAWTNAHLYPVGERYGLMFRADGTVIYIIDDFDVDGIWYHFFDERYTVNGNSLIIRSFGLTYSYSYSVSSDGNTLTLNSLGGYDVETLTRTQVGTLVVFDF